MLGSVYTNISSFNNTHKGGVYEIIIDFIISKKDGSLPKKPEDIYVKELYIPKMEQFELHGKVLPECHITVVYDLNDLQSWGLLSDDFDKDCDKISYLVSITDDGDVNIDEIKPPTKRLIKQKKQIIYGIISKIVEMLIDYDPKKDTKEIIRKKLFEILTIPNIY
jgi:hypothetical protein